jgi:hypothetical protein
VVGDIREWLSELLRQLVRTHRPIRQGGKDLATERVRHGLGGNGLSQGTLLMRRPDTKRCCQDLPILAKHSGPLVGGLYPARKQLEGKSRKQALRRLKRHLARAVCKILMAVDRRRKTSTTPNAPIPVPALA